MSILEAIILGLVQGLTEFIPVSSSGHLVIFQHWFSGTSNHLFLEYINIGTLAALLVFYRRRIVEILRDIFINKNSRLAQNIIITAIPAGVIGYLLADFIGSAAFFGSLVTVAITLFTVGIIMVVLEKLPKASPVEDGSKLSKKRALAIGLVQVVALIPGVSRSGSTIIAGRLSGLGARAAAEYSFLASLPIMLGVTVKLLIDGGSMEYFAANAGALLIGNVAAFISGILAVGFLLRYLENHSLALFGWYRIGLAAVLAVVILVQ